MGVGYVSIHLLLNSLELDRQELYKLIDKYLAGNANEEEIDLLSRYYNSFQQNLQWDRAELGEPSITETNLFARIQDKIEVGNRTNVVKTIESERNSSGSNVVSLNRNKGFFAFSRIGAAACVILILFVAALLWFRSDHTTEIASKNSIKKFYKNDIPPGSDKAILQLADGSTIVLDDANDGALAQQGNSKVIKLNGKLNYNALPGSNEVVYNSISTPRGGKFQIELPDGTQVWLNATSSLRFPTAFVEKNRRVEITGEAYFEVAKDKSKPFIVSVNGAEVEVLGTHFNVMAYKDEAVVKTTLLEGAIKFVKGTASNTLKPGQQAQVLNSGQVKVVDGVNLDEVVAWKNGLFNFQGEDIGTVIRLLARWYDVDVIYNEKIDDLFYAKIPRSTNLSAVLKLLEMTGKVHFEIDGRKITVKP